MQGSLYNNPMFAQGLSKLVQSFIGNPRDAARNELAASEALLNNQTAQYRDAIGDTGMSGDLSGMMVRALQAGPDWSRYAPGIGDAALKFGAMGFGRPELTPKGPIAQMMMKSLQPRGRSSSGTSSRPAAPGNRSVTQGASNRVVRMVREAGYEGADAAQIMDAILKDYQSGGGTLDEAASRILPNVSYEETVTDSNDSWYNPADWVRGPETEKTLKLPGAAAPAAPQAPAGNETQLLNEAREAISRGADKTAVAARLRDMGVDPGKL